MKKESTYICSKCEERFHTRAECRKHEETCDKTVLLHLILTYREYSEKWGISVSNVRSSTDVLEFYHCQINMSIFDQHIGATVNAWTYCLPVNCKDALKRLVEKTKENLVKHDAFTDKAVYEDLDRALNDYQLPSYLEDKN